MKSAVPPPPATSKPPSAKTTADPRPLPPPAPAPLAHQSLLKSPRSANGNELDLLVISVGGNNIGFGEIVGLDFLAEAYTTMKTRIDADLKPKAVPVIGVPNSVRDQDNRYCHRFEDGVGILPSNLLDPFIQMVGISTIGTLSPVEVDRGEFEWLKATVINPLNAKLEQIAFNFGAANWSFVNLNYMTKLHGICSSDAWFNTFKTSLATQDDFNGIAHPKRAG